MKGRLEVEGKGLKVKGRVEVSLAWPLTLHNVLLGMQSCA